MKLLLVLFFCLTLKAEDLKFWLTASALETSTTYDMETTMSAYNRFPNGHENSFLLGPLVPSRPAMYGAETSLNVGVLFLSHKLKQSRYPVARKIWWIAPAGLIAAHVWGGVHNQRLH